MMFPDNCHHVIYWLIPDFYSPWNFYEVSRFILLPHRLDASGRFVYRNTGNAASQAEIGIWVKARGRFCGSPGISPPENFWDCICKIMQSIQCIFGRKLVRNVVHNAFLNTTNGNAVAMRSGSFSTMRTALTRWTSLSVMHFELESLADYYFQYFFIIECVHWW